MAGNLPYIIQGGMGIAVSSWRLANAVSSAGGLGVVSGTGLSIVLPARLNDGDPGGHVRRALSHFPLPEVAQEIIDRYYIEGGKGAHEPYQRPQMWSLRPSERLQIMTVVANFVEVWLAKEGHNNPVGINLLEKVQLPTMASLYGAMLAGVDMVIMGAGIPMQVPGILDQFASHRSSAYRVDVAEVKSDTEHSINFEPTYLFPTLPALVGELKRPWMIPVVSSFTLARALHKRASGKVNGFVIEMPTAGGHNAPPRGEVSYNERGEPIYGKRDDVDLAKFRKLGLPFWLAGGYGSAEGLQAALDEGAEGVQVGTAFAFCEESGMEAGLRDRVVAQLLEGEVPDVVTSSVASPTGFPFKVVEAPGTVSNAAIYSARPRVCDLGYLRTVYEKDDGKVGYRCAAAPVGGYVNKGGHLEDTVGRVCLCNQLSSTAGIPQVRKGGFVEPAIITSGDDLPNIVQFIPTGQASYSANNVMETILAGVKQV
jgi:nitronate monooxygenase